MSDVRDRILAKIRKLDALGKDQRNTPEGKSAQKESRRLKKLHRVRPDELETRLRIDHPSFNSAAGRSTFDLCAHLIDLAPVWEGRRAFFEKEHRSEMEKVVDCFVEAQLWLSAYLTFHPKPSPHEAEVLDGIHVGLVDQAQIVFGATRTPRIDGPTSSSPQREPTPSFPGEPSEGKPSGSPLGAPEPHPPATSTEPTPAISSAFIDGYRIGLQCPGLDHLFPHQLEG